MLLSVTVAQTLGQRHTQKEPERLGAACCTIETLYTFVSRPLATALIPCPVASFLQGPPAPSQTALLVVHWRQHQPIGVTSLLLQLQLEL